jgi:hypothetical protein
MIAIPPECVYAHVVIIECLIVWAFSHRIYVVLYMFIYVYFLAGHEAVHVREGNRRLGRQTTMSEQLTKGTERSPSEWGMTPIYINHISKIVISDTFPTT